MSLNKIQQLIGSLTKDVEDNHKIATPVLSIKLANCLRAYPEDQTLGAMALVVDRMAANSTLFIRRAEFKDLYKRLHSRGTKFAQLFQEELGLKEVIEPEALPKEEKEDINIYESADPILSNALSSLFDKSPLKLYSQKLANVARQEVAQVLDIWGLRPTSLDVNTGSDKFLVLKADYETPKGITSFYVPIGLTGDRAEAATVFMGNDGVHDLNNSNVKNYVISNAGTKLKISGSNILDALTKAASDNRKISNAELALIKLNSSRKGEASAFEANYILGQKVVEAAVKDLELPKFDEFVSFEKQFTSPVGQANFTFGADKVSLARDVIVRDLVSFGHSNPQIVVADHNESTIFYGVSLDSGRVAFTVPIKITEGKVNKPTIMLCKGSVSTFNQGNIGSLYESKTCDNRMAAIASPLFELSIPDILNNIKEAMAEGNSAKAEDALNVLAERGDKVAYAIGFDMFMHGLNPKTACAKEMTKCSMVISNSTSRHPICGHTGLPLHKVYQDKHGNCRPLYNKGMDEDYEVGSFMTAKILMA